MRLLYFSTLRVPAPQTQQQLIALRLLVRLIAYIGYNRNFKLCIFHFQFNYAFSIFHSIMQPAWIYGQEFGIHDNSSQTTLDSYILVWGLSVCVKIIFIPPFICVGMNTEVGLYFRGAAQWNKVLSNA
jgi:hypothetical protein